MKRIKKFKDGDNEVEIESFKIEKPKKKRKPQMINHKRYSKKSYLREYYEEE